MRFIKTDYSKKELLEALADRFWPRDRTDEIQILSMPTFRAKRRRKKNLAFTLSPSKQWLVMLAKSRSVRRFQKFGTVLRHMRLAYSAYYGLSIKQLRRRLMTCVRVGFTQQVLRLEFKLSIFIYRLGLASSIADAVDRIERGRVRLNGETTKESMVVRVGDFIQFDDDLDAIYSRRTRAQNWRYMSFIHVEPKLRTVVIFCRPSARDIRLLKLSNLDSLLLNLLKLR